jgi:hypothetical protein
VARAVQRIYFHPLSKYPGPKLRAATRIPSHIETWAGTKHIKLAELHRKYGHVVRVNHDELSFTDPDSWKDVCTPSHPLFTTHLATDLVCMHKEIEDYDLNISRKMLTTLRSTAMAQREQQAPPPTSTGYATAAP